MHSRLTRLLAVTGVVLCAACSSAPAHHEQAATPGAQPQARATGQGSALGRDLAKIRAATAAYRTLDSAVAAGYPRTVARCLSHPEHGAMGFHHMKRELMDDNLELKRPEILLYSQTKDGKYKLNGVEYIVPYTARGPEKEPPVIMGMRLKRADDLKLWYLHVWIWEENKAGVFSDWNPAVSCPA